MQTTTLYKQILIFTTIILGAISLALLISLNEDKIKSFTQKAAATAAEGGKAFGTLLTEDLDPDF